ncbi:hypothetical protein AKJ08_3544 [Vulgatibacter incomptus]|uniref:Uncharacterized protein n=1 Tax=Vulgatibacter incomptus TaxID=1391653 RepID=A0A0K1PI15_9BACT|nr:hypothetical protein AKJ08_3544 [Vulgatibacter incomptus]
MGVTARKTGVRGGRNSSRPGASGRDVRRSSPRLAAMAIPKEP